MMKFSINFTLNESNIFLYKNKKVNNIDMLKHFYVIRNYYYDKKILIFLHANNTFWK